MCVCVCKIVAENESKTNFKWELTSLNRIVKKYFTSSFTFYLHSSLFFFLNRDFAFVYIPILLYLTCSNLAILSTTTATATERGKEKKKFRINLLMKSAILKPELCLRFTILQRNDTLHWQ